MPRRDLQPTPWRAAGLPASPSGKALMDAQGLVAAMADLSRAATTDFSIDEMLELLRTVAAQALDVDGAGVMVRQDDCNRFVHATTAFVQPVERLQELLQAGPCVECLRLQQPVAVADLAEQTGWPQFSELATELGLRSVLAIPLLSRGRGWGVLDLYRRQPGPWSEQELLAASVLADLAVSYLVMAHDRDDARSAHRALAHQANHDDLTGLPNRALLFDRLEHALQLAGRLGGGVGVMFLDLDLFKSINDTFGHAAGDLVLAEVASRLSTTLRAGDTLARFAGDEFVLVCEGLPAEPPEVLTDRMEALSQRLRHQLQQPIRVGAVSVVISASIGVAITTDRLSAQELLSDADTAMYTAKQHGRNQVHTRDHTKSSALSYGRQLERDLAGALQNDQLRVHYQPIVRAADRTVVAVEALLRWDQPGSGMLPAVSFIDIAVHTGLIIPIGQWVIHQTCAQMAYWQRELGARAPSTAFVNLSARELNDPSLTDTLDQALTDHSLRPQHLGLEIVEHHLADPAALARLQRHHERGHPLSIDDFGTGYSSLSRLLELPIDHTKIDKSFVAGLPTDQRRTRLMDNIVLLAADLDLQVIAEGVETAAQAHHLTQAGCQLLQGYHLGRPQSPEHLAATWAR